MVTMVTRPPFGVSVCWYRIAAFRAAMTLIPGTFVESYTSIGASKLPLPNITAMCGKCERIASRFFESRVLYADIDGTAVLEQEEVVSLHLYRTL
jgi:hypothetical protein